MSEQSDPAVNRNNMMLGLEQRVIGPEGIAAFVAEPQVNAQRLVRMSLLSNGVEFGMMTGDLAQIRARAILFVPFRGEEVIGSIVNADDYIFFEATAGAFNDQRPWFASVLRQLAQVRNANGSARATDVYASVPSRAKLVQGCLGPDGRVRRLHPREGLGLFSARFLSTTNTVIGIAVDSRNGETSLVATTPSEAAGSKAWRILSPPEKGRRYLTCSRPKVLRDNRALLYATSASSMDSSLRTERSTILQFAEGELRRPCVWRNSRTTPRVAVGPVNGQEDVFATYVAQPMCAMWEFQRL